MFGLVTLVVYKNFAFSRPNLNNEEYLTLISSVNSLFSFLRFTWSWALDYFPYRKVYGTLLVIQIVLAISFEQV